MRSNKEKKIITFKIGLLTISFSLLIVSLAQNAFYIGKSDAPEEVASLFAFLFGWFTIIMGSGVSWLANPLLFFSWILLFINSKFSLYCSILAVLFSISFLMLSRVVTNEGGVYREIVSYDIGYWIWLSSCIVNCVGIYSLRTVSKSSLR